MRKVIYVFLSAVVLSVASSSCSKSDSGSDNIVVYKVPADIVARYIALAFCNATAGINWHMENVAGPAASGAGNFDSSYTLQKTDTTAAVQYHYHVVSSFARFTTTPARVTYDYTAAGSFSSAAIYSQDQQQGNWVITGLDQAQMSYNGTGSDGGSQHAYLENVTFTCQFNYNFHDIMMDKLTLKATGGTADITVNGMGPASVLFDYTGTLTFLGNRQAKLILGGTTYNFSLDTGQIH